MKRIWNMAITGTGNIASKMAETIRGLDETAAYAVASRDPDSGNVKKCPMRKSCP